jgi:hypothetical protein
MTGDIEGGKSEGKIDGNDIIYIVSGDNGDNESVEYSSSWP